MMMKGKKDKDEGYASAIDDVFGAEAEEPGLMGEEEEEVAEVSKVEDPEEALGEIAGHLKMASDVIRRLGL